MFRSTAIKIATVGAMVSLYHHTSHACGIVGYIGTKPEEPAVKYVLEGIQILQNRGYDSAGVATIKPTGEIVTTKYASRGSTSDCIQILKEEASKNHSGDVIGIGHTRWATHGEKLIRMLIHTQIGEIESL